MSDSAGIADWLVSTEGEAWSCLEHAPVADAFCQSHRIGAQFGTLEPPEHEGEDCPSYCLQASSKAHHWVAVLDDYEINTCAGSWIYECGLCDPRVGSPA